MTGVKPSAVLLIGISSALGIIAGAGATAVLTPPQHTITAKVPTSHTYTDSKWKGCSAYWQDSAVKLATIVGDENTAIANALSTGDYQSGTEAANEATDKINAMTASIRQECRQ